MWNCTIKPVVLIVLLLGIASFQCFAQLSITAGDTDFTIDFDNTVAGVNNGTYAGEQPVANPMAGQLDSDAWVLNPNNTFQGVNDGGVGTGGWYAFEITSAPNPINRSVGVQPVSNFNNHSMVLSISNNTGSTINSLDIDFRLYANDAASRNATINYSGSAGTGSGNETTDNILATGTMVGLNGWRYISKSVTVTGLSISNGDSYTFTWSSDRGTGSNASDEWALDDIVFNATLGTDAPEIQLIQDPNGSNTDQACGFTYDFGSHLTGNTSDVTIRIENTGTANLVLNNLPLVVGGANSGEFSITTQPSSPIPPGNFADMVVRFTPAGDGAKSASIIINNTDGDENLCIINLSGSGVAVPGTLYSQGVVDWTGENAWNSAPDGTGVSITDPDDSNIDIVIQSGHVVTLNASGKALNNLTIKSGGQILAGGTATRFLEVSGTTITNNGTMGNGSSPDGLSLKIQGTGCNISGTGTTDLNRILKEGTGGTSSLSIDQDINLRFGGTAIFNNQPGSTFNVSISANQTLAVLGNGTTKGDLSIDGVDGGNSVNQSGTFSVAGTLEISGDLYVTTDNSSGADIEYLINPGGKIVVGGLIYGNAGMSTGPAIAKLTIAGGTLELTGSGAIFTALDGSLDDFDFSAGSIVDYNNGGPQFIENSFTYADLGLSGGGTKTLLGNTEVEGTLFLNSGILDLGNFDLTMGQDSDIAGASAAAYVRTWGSGALQRPAGSGSGPVMFPVGQSAYAPVTLLNSNISSDLYSVRVVDLVLSQGSTGTPVDMDVVNHTWFITEAVAGSSDLSISVQWDGAAETSNFSRDNCYLSRWTGTGWDAGPMTAATGSNPYSITRSGITSLSPFAVGSSGVLPVEMLFFQAFRRETGVDLAWATATETNNKAFVVERSTDGRNFEDIGTVAGKGTTTIRTDYRYTDANPLPGINYYRLRQIDLDGRFEFSEIRSARFMKENGLHSRLYPSITSNIAIFEVSDRLERPGIIRFADAFGRTLLTDTFPEGVYQKEMDVSALPAGHYFVKLEDTGYPLVRLVKVD